MPDRFRPIALSDLPQLFELHRRVEVFDGIPIVTPWEEFEEIKDDPSTNLGADTVMVERDGTAIGYGRVWYPTADDGDLARAFLIGEVDPDYRRQGVGSRILEWSMTHAKNRLAGAPAHQKRFIRTHAYDFETGAISLYRRFGLEPIRYFAELIRPLDHSVAVTEIDRVEIVPWDSARSDEIRLMMNLAFRDHWGSAPTNPEVWEHRLAATGSRLDQSFIAIAGDHVVGAAHNLHYPTDQVLTGRFDGWIGSLGTHPDFRKRGIASALIENSCEAFRQLGWDHAMLGVDSENPTGAFDLYQRLGFRPLYRMIQHQLEV